MVLSAAVVQFHLVKLTFEKYPIYSIFKILQVSTFAIE